ncbi:TLR adapter interacting with SLC15A4 on the lysosome isoform X2 [Hyla sarda]|nr:TLR adapter interacting with SLC15A4 on the lysosome isoform X2 [Hyla sarda]XP_056412119.1 TLR adapter interacting with SLC15A4 on the lysosome isoform X2 [Hyla sarda]
MLSEGYLYKIQAWYDNDISILPCKMETEHPKEVAGVCTVNYISAHETRSRRIFRRIGSFKRHNTQVTRQEGECNIQDMTEGLMYECENPCSTSISENSNTSKEAYLVPSSCKHICRDYNDLHVAGDQVMAIHSTMSDFTCDSSFEFCEGPFLQSSEIPSNIESLGVQANNLTKKGSKRHSWKVYSEKDKSILNHEQPMTNSILNEYLERKVIELYKQYMMDISCSASTNHIMTSELIMNNIQQISMQLSREQNMETNKAKDMVISYLLRLASEKQSNVISTPDLKISSNLV